MGLLSVINMGSPCLQPSALSSYTHYSGLKPHAVYTDCNKNPRIPNRAIIFRNPSKWMVLKRTDDGSSRGNIRTRTNATDSQGRYKRQPKEVIMVDPLEAKRLAVLQMQQLQAETKFKRQCKIEAINGAWAMLGLTAGLVIEGYSGKGILSQLAGYLNAMAAFLDQFIPS